MRKKSHTQSSFVLDLALEIILSVRIVFVQISYGYLLDCKNNQYLAPFSKYGHFVRTHCIVERYLGLVPENLGTPNETK
jgi:hypothetical protein